VEEGLKKGDRVGAIFRIDEKRRVLALAGYGVYQGEDIKGTGRGSDFNWDDENFGVIKLDSGEMLDTNICHSWGMEAEIQGVVKHYESRRFRILTVQAFR
jgi:hypothetical protein